MGGIEIDTSGRTSLRGLWAAGESATGVHGANRLGGNGLSEALVFGRVAGCAAAEAASGRELSLRVRHHSPPFDERVSRQSVWKIC